jgi:hypothetical protein
MKLTHFTQDQVAMAINTLIEQNRIFGDKPAYTSLGYTINEYDNKYNILFFVDYYEDQNNSEEWQTVTILKDETFRKLVKDVQDVIYAYNDVTGFEDEEEYNFHNNDKSEW